MNNAAWCLMKGIKFSDIRMNMRQAKYGGGYYVKDNSTKEKLGQIVGETALDGRPLDANGAFKRWLDLEHEDYKEPKAILTGKERGYLKQVIAPFRNRVTYISKQELDPTLHENFIRIHLSCEDVASLPGFFPEDDLFDGMELRKKYTLQELEL